MRLLGCVSRSPRWSATLGAPVDASRLSEPKGRLSVCDLLTRRERTPLALASCAGSRFRGTNHEFVQSNECEARERAVHCRRCEIIREHDLARGIRCDGSGLPWLAVEARASREGPVSVMGGAA